MAPPFNSFPQVFTASDVRVAKDPLVKLLRLIFYRRNITSDDFVDLHSQYWNYWHRGARNGQTDNESTHRNNLRRTLLNDTISWNKFRVAVFDLLRQDLIRFCVTVRDPKTGEPITYCSDDDPDVTKQNPQTLGGEVTLRDQKSGEIATYHTNDNIDTPLDFSDDDAA